MDYKPALLTLEKPDHDTRMIRMMFFESHLDALEAANRLRKQGYRWVLSVVEVYRVGELPEDAQNTQLPLFGEPRYDPNP